MRAALYARYSTDRQSESSTADQLRQARERCAREGWHVVAEHADDAVSGSTPVALRPGGRALLADALAGRIDVLVLEGLDRLSREVGEAETVTKRLEHRGVRIVGLADGYDSHAAGRKVLRIARGLVNELYLDDLACKTRRGLQGQLARGYHVGGVCYGYRSQPSADGRGRVLVVDEPQADVVRRIYSDFAGGNSARGIVHALNAEGIPSPRGGTWAVSALVGGARHGAGLLQSEVYIGRIVWGRRQWIKDPDSGRRRYVERPREEWQVRDAPELRIVGDELWHAVRERQRTGPARGTRTGRGQAPRTLLAGVLRCGMCGGPMVAVDARRYGCHARADRGPSVCPGVTVRRDAVERRILGEVRDELLSPAALAEMTAAVQQALRAQASAPDGAVARRAQELQAEVARLVDAVAQIGLSDALRARLTAAETELEQVRTRGERAAAAGRLTPDAVTARWRAQVMDLQAALSDAQDRDRARTLLGELLGPVQIVRDEGGTWAEMDKPAERLAATGGLAGVVAGASNSYRRRVRVG